MKLGLECRESRGRGFGAYHGARGGDQDVVGLDVSVQDTTVAQVCQGHQHLGRICPHGLNVEPDAAPVLLRQLPQIDVLHRNKSEIWLSFCSQAPFSLQSTGRKLRRFTTTNRIKQIAQW